MDGSSEIVITAHDYDVMEEYGRMRQAYELLSRNADFSHDVEKIRNRYNLGQYPFEGETLEDEYNEYPHDGAERERFFADVRDIATKIRSRGDWEIPVRRLTIGYEPELALLPDPERKKIIITPHSDHVELKLYGDLTVPELRTALRKIRKSVVDVQNPAKSDGKAKYKPKLVDNLVILDMANRGVSPKDIAAYCNEHDIKDFIQDYEISKYVETTRKQIAKIYA